MMPGMHGQAVFTFTIMHWMGSRPLKGGKMPCFRFPTSAFRFLPPLLLFLLPAVVSLPAQSINDFRESRFAFKVKQVDEFIDRFNHAPHTLARREHPGLTHRDNLLSLFDQEAPHWEASDIEAFAGQVLAQQARPVIGFYDDDWYASVDCTFRYGSKLREFTLILQNQRAANGGSKWVIVSILGRLEGVICEDIPRAVSTGQYLHPMSHAANFIELERAFEDRDNLHNYFDPWNQGMDFLAFKHALWDGTLKYEFNRGITYHFLQLDGWIFTLDYFLRDDPNTGWLISSLSRATPEEKARYRSINLNL